MNEIKIANDKFGRRLASFRLLASEVVAFAC